MKILITGGSGFVGKHLKNVLKQAGNEVFTVDLNPQDSDFGYDLRAREFCDLVAQLQPVAIVHLAGVQYLHRIKRQKRFAFFQQNVDMAEGLISAIKATSCVKSLIYLSTDMVYGKPTRTPVLTTSETRPIGPYGASKLAVEKLFLEHSESSSFRLCILRPRLIAGRGRKGTIDILTQLMKRNLPVPVFGKGTNRYQLVSVIDVCDAIALSLKTPREGTFNLGSDNPPEVRKLISSTIERLNSRSIVLKLPATPLLYLLRFLDWMNLSPLSPEQFEIAGLDYVLDTSETKYLLGWAPKNNDFEILLESAT